MNIEMTDCSRCHSHPIVFLDSQNDFKSLDHKKVDHIPQFDFGPHPSILYSPSSKGIISLDTRTNGVTKIHTTASINQYQSILSTQRLNRNLLTYSTSTHVNMVDIRYSKSVILSWNDVNPFVPITGITSSIFNEHSLTSVWNQEGDINIYSTQETQGTPIISLGNQQIKPFMRYHVRNGYCEAFTTIPSDIIDAPLERIDVPMDGLSLTSTDRNILFITQSAADGSLYEREYIQGGKVESYGFHREYLEEINLEKTKTFCDVSEGDRCTTKQLDYRLLYKGSFFYDYLFCFYRKYRLM